MAHGHAVVASSATYGPFPCGEHDAGSLVDAHGMPARLGARTLLDEQEFAAAIVHIGPVEPENDLQRKRHIAVDVLVKAVVAAGVIGEEQRRWPLLAGRLAARDEVVQFGRIS